MADSLKSIVLIGGGHAHMQVIKAFTKKALGTATVTLIDPNPTPDYSGMVPGCVSNLYTQNQTRIQLPPLASWAGITYIRAFVTDIDLENNLLTLDNSATPISFDTLSIDIGSRTRHATTTPGVAEFAIPTRPIGSLVEAISLAESTPPSSVVVSGAGAAGIELAFALRARWQALFPTTPFTVTLLDAGPLLVPNESPACQAAVTEALKARNIETMHNVAVSEVREDELRLEDGRVLPASTTIWSTGAQSQALAETFKSRGLAVDDRGWIKVNRNLQSTSHPHVFAAGDCCTVLDPHFKPPPKAGVYAVRAGPILIQNLVAHLNGEALVDYIPQTDFLKLLMCGDGTAIGFRFGIAMQGKWVWQLKNHIDQSFMDLFKQENLPDASAATLSSAQYDCAAAPIDISNLSAADAKRELLRVDGDVDYLRNWAIVKKMMADDEFREQVVQCNE